MVSGKTTMHVLLDVKMQLWFFSQPSSWTHWVLSVEPAQYDLTLCSWPLRPCPSPTRPSLSLFSSTLALLLFLQHFRHISAPGPLSLLLSLPGLLFLPVSLWFTPLLLSDFSLNTIFSWVLVWIPPTNPGLATPLPYCIFLYCQLTYPIFPLSITSILCVPQLECKIHIGGYLSVLFTVVPPKSPKHCWVQSGLSINIYWLYAQTNNIGLSKT